MPEGVNVDSSSPEIKVTGPRGELTRHFEHVAIVFEQDSSEVKIIVGTHVFPEFGTIAMIVLAVAIVSIIVITAKTKTALIPKL